MLVLKRPALLRLLAAAALVALTIAVFQPVGGHSFINFDDDRYVVENRRVREGLTPAGVAWAVTTFHAANWHPLTWLSLMLDAQAFGPGPRGFHLVNLGLHAAAAVLFFLVFARMTGAVWPCALAAALFAVHPLHVESVAWVAERKDVLSALLWALTTGLYLRYAAAPGAVRYAAALAAFALGLMAKPMLVTLPVVLLLLDFWPLGRLRRGVAPLLEKIPFLALAAVSGLLTSLAQRQGGATVELRHLPFAQRLGNAAASCGAYLAKAVWPSGLAPFYPFPLEGPPAWEVMAGVTVLALGTALALRLRRDGPWFAVGWCWYLVTLLPVIGLVQIGGQARADRYTYLPLVGPFLAVSWALAAAARRHPRWRAALAGIVAAWVGALAVTAHAQAALWKDNKTLFGHALAVTRGNDLAEFLYGLGLAQEGRHAEAIAHYEAALRIRPGDGDTHNNLGNALLKLGRPEEALVHHREAMRLRPDNPKHAFNLGLSLLATGKYAEGEAALRRYLAQDPANPQARAYLAHALTEQGRHREARDELAEALRLDPGQERTHYAMGVVLLRLGERGEAAVQFREALRINPASEAARKALASIAQAPAPGAAGN